MNAGNTEPGSRKALNGCNRQRYRKTSMIQVIRTADHPEANGRQPLAGERDYVVSFPHENGDDYIEIRMGERGYRALCDMIDAMRRDDEAESR